MAKKKKELFEDAAPAAPSHEEPKVNLDDRKLTKKQRDELIGWETSPLSSLDSYMQGMIAAADAGGKMGKTFTATSDKLVVVGVPCPALAFEYLTGQSVFPLGIIIQLAGDPAACKSSLLFEFMRWIRLARGGSHLLETEHKLNPQHLHRIVGISEEAGNLNNVLVHPCPSLEYWQRGLTNLLQTHKKKMIGTKEDPGPGKTVPILLGIDSVGAAAAEERVENVVKSGASERSFAVEANLISSYLKVLAPQLSGWPFVVVLNNHSKEGQDDRGFKKRRTLGGSSIVFHESYGLELSKIKNLSAAHWYGRQILIRCVKNSFGIDGRQVMTRLLFGDTKEKYADGLLRPVMWDWDWSLVYLLLNSMGRDRARFEEVGIHIKAPKTSDVENTAWSSTLGMREADAVPWTELGAMLAADAGFVAKFREAAEITVRPQLSRDYDADTQRGVEKLP